MFFLPLIKNLLFYQYLSVNSNVAKVAFLEGLETSIFQGGVRNECNFLRSSITPTTPDTADRQLHSLNNARREPSVVC